MLRTLVSVALLTASTALFAQATPPSSQPRFRGKKVGCRSHDADQDNQANGCEDYRIVESHGHDSRRAFEVVNTFSKACLTDRTSR